MLAKGALVAVFLAIAWTSLQKHKYKHRIELDMPKIEPCEIWTLLANFRLYVTVNPTVKYYSILSEETVAEGVTEAKVSYTEQLVYLPSLWHNGTGTVRALAGSHGRPYRIESTHETQILGNSLNTIEDLELQPVEHESTNGESTYGTLLISNVEYECPWILSIYCSLEFRGQRSIINKYLMILNDQAQLERDSRTFVDCVPMKTVNNRCDLND